MNNIIMQKLFIKNTVPRTNYTQLHELGGLRERRKLPNGVRGAYYQNVMQYSAYRGISIERDL